MSYGNYPDLRLVKRVLVIKLRHLGDVLLTSPVFTNLKKVLPDAEIEVLLYKDTLPLLEGHQAISDFLLWDRTWKNLPLLKKIYKEIQLWREIHRRQYDLVINLTEGDRGALAALVSGAGCRVGIDPQGKGFLLKKKIYTHLIKECRQPRHAVEKNLDALRRIGIFPELQERDLFLHVPEQVSNQVKNLLGAAGFALGNYVLIHPVSRWLFKCPPPDKIAQIIQELDALGHKVILTSGPDPKECALLNEIESLCPKVKILNLGGKISVKQLAALIQLCKCLVCVDSVPLHISSALKTPVVVLFGPTSESNWGPWMHPSAQIVARSMSCRPCLMDGCGGSKKSDCLYNLSVQSVVNAFKTVCSIEPQICLKDLTLNKTIN